MIHCDTYVIHCDTSRSLIQPDTAQFWSDTNLRDFEIHRARITRIMVLRVSGSVSRNPYHDCDTDRDTDCDTGSDTYVIHT